eukprot:434469-Rhodomonas_salina.1
MPRAPNQPVSRSQARVLNSHHHTQTHQLDFLNAQAVDALSRTHYLIAPHDASRRVHSYIWLDHVFLTCVFADALSRDGQVCSLRSVLSFSSSYSPVCLKLRVSDGRGATCGAKPVAHRR